ncbi:MAG: protein phosphatase 2C domain-containing protein [Bacteroidales bacterium]|nr:protein phosphatase 2C domain-containing protein [Bacteroidales bacterium]
MKNIINTLLGKYFPEGISDARQSDIADFISEKIYKEYKEYNMNKEIVIKNKVDSLNIALPNAKVGEYYSQLIKIEDPDVVEYWVEGMDGTGLTVEQEIVLKQEDQHPKDETIVLENVSDEQTFDETVTSETISEESVYEGKVIDSNQTPSVVVGTNEIGIVIKGNPATAGDFDIVLKYKYKGWYDGCNILERKLKFAINPDPRSLWKDIPTDKNIKFYKEDYICEYVTVPENDKGPQKDIVAASKRGRSHAHEGKARDDHFQLYHNDENGWYIMAVADGAGSAKYSRKGSAVACETCVEHCKQALETPTELENAIIELSKAEAGVSNRTISTLIYNIIGGAALKAHRAISDTAAANEDQVRDYSTTLLLAICKKFDFGWFVASFWVGDGAMCIYDKERQYIRVLGAPDGGEYAGQTRFLTMKEIFTPESIMSRLKYSIEKDFSALMLMTDGISDPFFETDANLNRIEKWNDLWDNINSEVELTDDNSESQYQLLKWLDFWSQGNHDDRTIAILY